MASSLSTFLDDPAFIVFEATERGDLQRIRREVEGRQWAAAHGLPTAETIAVDPAGRWMVSRRIEDQVGESMAYLEAALEVAERIQRTPLPAFRTPAATWAAPRSATIGNGLRLAAAGVRVREFLATRAAAEALPRTVTVHNDFHRANVLNLGDEVVVIDWEYTAAGPRHHDFLRLLVDVRDETLAQQGWELALAAVPRGDHRALGQQFGWLALRTYGSELCAPPSGRDDERLAFKRRRWLRAKEWIKTATTAHW